MVDAPKINTPYFQALAKLPDLAKSVLTHDETSDFNVDIADQHHLTLEQSRALAHIIQFLILKSLAPAAVLARVARDLQLPPDKAKSVTCDLLGWRMLPLEWYVGAVQPTLISLGAKPEDYLKKLRTIYPEVFSQGPLLLSPTPDPDDAIGQANLLAEQASQKEKSGVTAGLLENFNDRLTSFKGRAEILLRLTSLSVQVDEAMKNNKLPLEQGQQFLQELDNISFAVNTQDLNAFESQVLKHRLERLLVKLQPVLG